MSWRILQRPAEALLTFQHVLKLNPRHWDAAYRCGFLLDKLERPAEALSYFDLGDRLKPNQAVVAAKCAPLRCRS